MSYIVHIVMVKTPLRHYWTRTNARNFGHRIDYIGSRTLSDYFVGTVH